MMSHFGQNRRVFGYFASWATGRSGRGKFNISDIDPNLCDYLLYAFFDIDENGSVNISDSNLHLDIGGGQGNIRQFNQLKRKNSSLKTLASIGGEKVSPEIFSHVAASSSLRSRFASNARRFCQKYGFDGVDIDWEFPKSGDRWNFVHLLQALSSELHGAGLILTVAVGAHEKRAQEAYDIPRIARHVDYILLMAYDYNGHWDRYTGHNAPLYAGPSDRTDFQQTLNIDHSVKYWLREGASADKLILGVPAYGRTFNLVNTESNNPRAAAWGPGDAGRYTEEAGFLAYYEVLKNLQKGWTKVWDDTQKVPYAYSEDQWMSYDGKKSIAKKCKYVVEHDLGGVMMWSIDMDDFDGNFGPSYPLLKTVNKCLKR